MAIEMGSVVRLTSEDNKGEWSNYSRPFPFGYFVAETSESFSVKMLHKNVLIIDHFHDFLLRGYRFEKWKWEVFQRKKRSKRGSNWRLVRNQLTLGKWDSFGF